MSIEEEVLASIIALHFGSDVFLRWYVHVSVFYRFLTTDTNIQFKRC